GEPARAGVNSFGFGGTNAHVVLEEAPSHPHGGMRRNLGGREGEDVVIPLSARTPDALADVCRSFRELLSRAPNEWDLGDLAYSPAAGGAPPAHPLALATAGRDEPTDALAASPRGNPHVSVVTARRRPDPRRSPVFVFSDEVGLRPRAAREIARRDPAFREA